MAKHIEEIMRTCVHFNGVQHDTCRAGVNYHELFGVGVGCFAHLCCLSEPVGSVACDKSVYPTRAQAEAEQGKREKRFKQVMQCVVVAKEHAEKEGLREGHGGVSQLDCPTGCGGILRYSVASVNGHMYARCSTEDCVSWME